MYKFWKGLNAFRLSDYGKVFRQAEKVPIDYYQWIEPDNAYQLGYFVGNSILVLLNTREVPNSIEIVDLLEGTWKQIVNSENINYLNGVDAPKKYRTLTGGNVYLIELDPVGIAICMKRFILTPTLTLI